ncbi:MAG: tetratricopeptide repeat protein [Halioglobus sp.]
MMSFTEEEGAAVATLADVPLVSLPQKTNPLPDVSLQELAEIYADVLPVTEDPQARLQVEQRLADIQLLRAEQELAEAKIDSRHLSGAISSYEMLIAQHPENPGQDQLLYQLSKAYELNGNTAQSVAALERLSTTHPDSEHRLEAEFRKAESYFVAADYAAAEQSYGQVIANGTDSAYFLQAEYMRGWSLFKLGQYRNSIASFTGTLDLLIPESNNLDALGRGQRELAQDCLRVLAVVFSYLEGANTIGVAYDQLGPWPYQHLLYQALGTHYLGQKRFRDSAETYAMYIEQYPLTPVAPQFQLDIVKVYEVAGFSDLLLEEKQDYVEAYAVSGEYWSVSGEAVQAEIRPTMKQFLDELASYYHALAQQREDESGDPELAQSDYRRAAVYYRLYIDSFPTDPGIPEKGFLLAEAEFEAGQYLAAIEAYEWVAYETVSFARAPEAAYSAILAYGQLSDSEADYRERRIASELRFASSFPQDPRAAVVLGHAAESLLAASEYQLAIIAAATLVHWQPDRDIELSAHLVMGISHFELQQFESSEQSYQSALQILEPGDPNYVSSVEQMAAAIYKQGEVAASAGDKLEAGKQFERVLLVAPDSQVRLTAQFDAANQYLQAGELEAANRLLIDFRERYADHPLSDSIAGKLVASYEQLAQWSNAARELDKIHTTVGSGEQQRQALYLAAQYYDKAGEMELARLRYRSYAHNWPNPVPIHFEAMFRLAELYQASGQEEKRRFWLKKIVLAHDQAGPDKSDRSYYLAAMSSSVLAEDQYVRYSKIRLYHPIKRSIRKKREAMESALALFNQTNNYGVQQFSTLATFRMAQIYQQMSDDLMRSQRPGDIDELALEQYELLLEEQAYPFEEKAIAIHETNARRSWEGVYDDWVQSSFDALTQLLPARYRKLEWAIAPAEETPGALAPSGDNDNTDRAKQWFESAISSDSEDISAYNLYAIYLRKQGRFSEAEQIYLQALSIWEPQAATHRNIGILYDLYMGEQERALRHFNRYQILTGEDDRAVRGWIADLQRQLSSLAKGA